MIRQRLNLRFPAVCTLLLLFSFRCAAGEEPDIIYFELESGMGHEVMMLRVQSERSLGLIGVHQLDLANPWLEWCGGKNVKGDVLIAEFRRLKIDQWSESYNNLNSHPHTPQWTLRFNWKGEYLNKSGRGGYPQNFDGLLETVRFHLKTLGCPASDYHLIGDGK